jgi:undecaprenyl-diphosphatase
MMTFLQVLLLSFIQGLTEFLPVSSSGHLVIIPALLKFTTTPSILFDVTLHLGTLMAVVAFLWKDIVQIVKGLCQSKKEYWVLLLKIIIAVMPAAIMGLLFNNELEMVFQFPLFVGYAYFGTAILLFLTLFLKDKGKTMFTITWWDALIIGLMQACALVPGFSRSGFTLVAALVVGMKKKEAFRFSFLIAIPAILGAFLFKLPDLQMESSFGLYIFGFVIAMIVGFFSLYLLKMILKKSFLYLFALYCLLLAIFTVWKFQ